MYFQANVSQQLVKTGKVEFNYNKNRFFKKYEVGYWEIYQDFNNITRNPINGPYRVFRPVYRTSTYQKAVHKLEKLQSNVMTLG